MSLFIIRDMGFKDINPVDAGYEQCTPSYSYGDRIRNYYLLHYVVSGKGNFFLNGKKYEINPGQVFMIKPGEDARYTADSKNPWQYIWIGFNGEQAKKLDDLPEPVFPGKASVFEKIKGCLAYGTMRETYLVSCISLLLCNLFENPGNIERVMSITHYIDIHFMDNLKVEDIAMHFNLNRKYLSRIFKAETGFTIQEYLLEIKMSAAKLCIKSNRSVNETAQLLGYCDQSAFSRAYKNYYGYSPSAELKQHTPDSLSQYSKLSSAIIRIINGNKPV